ncbi:MAG TPA: 50S ribosomal protein L35 [Chitinophagales bacterium]|nr:50S ribosomal protein L35 [Chitinophagales bacterium]
MPKMKTNSSAKKRFKVTGTGKIKRKRAFKRHILTSKENSQKARLSSPALVDKTQEKQILRLLSQG